MAQGCYLCDIQIRAVNGHVSSAAAEPAAQSAAKVLTNVRKRYLLEMAVSKGLR